MAKERCINGLDFTLMYNLVKSAIVHHAKYFARNAIVFFVSLVLRYFTPEEERENIPWNMYWNSLSWILKQDKQFHMSIVKSALDVWLLTIVKMQKTVVVL